MRLSESELKAFNQSFGSRIDEKRIRNLRILIGGMTACMHHSPRKAQEMMVQLLKSVDLTDAHWRVLKTKSSSQQLKKYYRSSSEAYLVLKVYDQLLARYASRPQSGF